MSQRTEPTTPEPCPNCERLTAQVQYLLQREGGLVKRAMEMAAALRRVNQAIYGWSPRARRKIVEALGSEYVDPWKVQEEPEEEP